MTLSKLFHTCTIIAIALISIQVHAAGNPTAGEEKAAICASCHGADGISTMAAIPGMVVPHLAGQYADYLIKSLQDYRSGARNNPSMTGMSAGLSDQDIEDLAAFYAAQEGLGVVNAE